MGAIQPGTQAPTCCIPHSMCSLKPVEERRAPPSRHHPCKRRDDDDDDDAKAAHSGGGASDNGEGKVKRSGDCNTWIHSEALKATS